ncbi:MAG: CPBP family intramembrane metalloprotease [Anaerolineales bacterium]|nr:CPBP family intramembrane metalloprotease [Anaerolineales bacterium]
MSAQILYTFWRRIFKHPWWLSVVLFLILAGVCAYGLFGPEKARRWIMFGFFILWFTPFLFFSKAGRRNLGIKKIGNPLWLLWGFLLGGAASSLVFILGFLLYGRNSDNWYVSVLVSWLIDEQMMELPRLALFAMFTFPAVVFSPVGEEFFFRGIIHETVKEKWGVAIATVVNAMAFGLVHLMHHGIQWGQRGLQVSIFSGLLWFVLMMGVSWLFTICRLEGDAIWPAVFSHAAFNLTKNMTIFWFLF